MAAFILSTGLHGSIGKGILWLLAPIVTAIGFTTGITVFEHLGKRDKTRFFRIFTWPLVGCAVGAIVVYWSGPMLIVFGMLTLGTVSVVLREMVLRIKQGKNQID
jgi:hypothetical protein